MVRVGDVRFHNWVSLPLTGGWTDTFVFRISPTDGLPPGDYARLVRALAPRLRKLRWTASLWVQVHRVSGHPSGEGRWFVQEVRNRLRGAPVPVAVTAGDVRPQLWDFSFFPWTDSPPLPSPPSASPYLKGRDLSVTARKCLHVLARADCAYTAEVASLANVSRPTARAALSALQESGLVRLVATGRSPFWQIRRPGLSLALRSWGLPPGVSFLGRRERGPSACQARGAPAAKKAPAGRHRRTARLWPAWLRRAWAGAEIWAGWSEVACGRRRPDALCWGRLQGAETLFWLEVESGNRSRQLLRKITLIRVNRALVYARGFSVRLVFALLGPPWVRKEAVKVFVDSPEDLAVVLEDWKRFGELPVPVWGRVRWS
jgi:hypothetical protein